MAWQCYIGRWLSIGKHAFSTCRPGKTNVSFKTIFNTGDYVDETYKKDKFGWDRFTGGASTQWWNITLLWLFSPFFSVSSSRLQVAIFNRFARLIAQTTCSVSYTCLLGVWCLKIHFWGVSGPKNTKISTRFRTCRFAAEISSALEPSGVNYH